MVIDCVVASTIGLFAALSLPEPAAAQMPGDPPEIYTTACARCHAADGSGKVDQPTVKTESLDFRDCDVASREPDNDWELAIGGGGLAVGLSPEMPAFGDVLSQEQVTGLVAYLRGFCKDPRWPHGNLNYPRPLIAEKAYPEDELVFLPVIAHKKHAGDGVKIRTVYERRFGRRAHGEISVPFASVDFDGSRQSGIADITVAAKYVLHADRPGTRIVTGGLELQLPTGNEGRGLGDTRPVFEPYLALGTVRWSTYLQGHVKLELPTRDPWANRELVYNAYAGWDLSKYLNTWTVGIELNGVERELALTPQVRKGLTRTGALAAAGGVRLPVNKRDEQDMQWLGYLLWEYLDPVRARR